MFKCHCCNSIIKDEKDLVNIRINLLDDDEFEEISDSVEAYGYYAECKNCRSAVIDYVDEESLTIQEIIDDYED